MSTMVNSTTATHSRTTTDPTGIQSQSSREGQEGGRRNGRSKEERGSRHEPNCNQHPTRLDQHLVGSLSFLLAPFSF